MSAGNDRRTLPELRVIPYYSQESRTTAYIVTNSDDRRAVIVDPVRLDRGFYALMVAHELELVSVLITRPEEYMERSLRTLGKVYDFELISGGTDLPAASHHTITGESELLRAGLQINAIPALPHSRASCIYRINRLVFTGSIVHAGTLGETASQYQEAVLVATIKDYLFTLDADNLLLPSVGPPSTIRAERELSPYYRDA